MRRPLLSLRSPNAIRKVALVWHINTSCRPSILPDDALYFFRTSLSLFWPGAILLSHLPFRSLGAGLCRKIPALICFLTNLTFHSQFLWHVLNPNLSQSGSEGQRGRERQRGGETQRRKISLGSSRSVVFWFSWWKNRFFLWFHYWVWAPHQRN